MLFALDEYGQVAIGCRRHTGTEMSLVFDHAGAAAEDKAVAKVGACDLALRGERREHAINDAMQIDRRVDATDRCRVAARSQDHHGKNDSHSNNVSTIRGVA
jgi:hypothetical protein